MRDDSGRTRGRVQLLGVGKEGQTTYRLFRTLCDGLIQRGVPADYELRQFPKGVRNRLREFLECWRLLKGANVLVIHTPLAPSVLPVLAAIARNVPIVSYIWDLHPESTALLGAHRSRLNLAAYWMVERSIMLVSGAIVVPSADYLGRLKSWKKKIHIIPLWPSDAALSADRLDQATKGPVRVAFAGQVNAARGLDEGIEVLKTFWHGRDVELHLFSGTEFSASVSDPLDGSFEVINRGFMAPEDLQQELSKLDFGWVCLDPEFELPAYPSKSLAYISAGLPVLYSGPPLPAFRGWLKTSGLGIPIDDGTGAEDDLKSLRCGLADRRREYFSEMQRTWFEPSALKASKRRHLHFQD